MPYAGNILRVNLSTGQVSSEALDRKLAHDFIFLMLVNQLLFFSTETEKLYRNMTTLRHCTTKGILILYRRTTGDMDTPLEFQIQKIF